VEFQFKLKFVLSDETVTDTKDSESLLKTCMHQGMLVLTKTLDYTFNLPVENPVLL
jgi:hypothetical protein